MANPEIDIQKLPWRDMANAPRDGTIIAVWYYPWNIETNPMQLQAAQWLVSSGGTIFAFRQPYQPDTEVYAKGWLTWEEINNARP